MIPRKFLVDDDKEEDGCEKSTDLRRRGWVLKYNRKWSADDYILQGVL